MSYLGLAKAVGSYLFLLDSHLNIAHAQIRIRTRVRKGQVSQVLIHCSCACTARRAPSVRGNI